MKIIIQSLLMAASTFAIVSDASPSYAFSGLKDQIVPSNKAVILANANNPETAGAENFVAKMAERGINFLANPEITAEQRKLEFKKLLHESFDMKTIARFAMGRYWSQASEAQRTEYLANFEKMIIEVYSKRFGDYQGQDFKVDSARPEGENDVIVTSHIVPKNGEKITVDWRVRNKNAGYKVVDVIVEGVSMATTQRSEFASVVQRGGGDVAVLLDHLAQ
jgi:phospholipid transport system substrate-binding protein